jgi:uncharacterized delta-60 repeat protein
MSPILKKSITMRKIYSLVLCFMIVGTTRMIAQPGSLDYTFGSSGTVSVAVGVHPDASCNDILLLNDGKYLMAGDTGFTSGHGTFVVVRIFHDGSIDNSFGLNGRAYWDFNSSSSNGGMGIQSDGKIIQAGSNNNDGVIIRYSPDGSPDQTFGTSGVERVHVQNVTILFYSMCIMPNDRILAIGSAGNNSFLFCCLPDGTPDATFGSGGMVSTETGPGETSYGSEVELQGDGKILVTGSANIRINDTVHFFEYLARYNADGTIDNTFGVNGTVKNKFPGNETLGGSIQLLPDGKIILGVLTRNYPYYKIGLAGFTSDGSLDTSFGTNGFAYLSIPETSLFGPVIRLQPDGKFLVSALDFGQTSNLFLLARFLSDGTPDTYFGSSGTITIDLGMQSYCQTMVLQDDDKVVLAGEDVPNYSSGYEFAAARINLGENLHGTVYAGNLPVIQGRAILFSWDSTGNNVVSLDTCLVDTGYYHFDNVAPGNYYILGELIPSSPGWGHYLPTYYGDAINWDSATMIRLGHAVNPYDIHLVQSSAMIAGKGAITGSVNTDYKIDGAESGVPGITVFLFDPGKQALAYSKTNDNGAFSFNDIAFGSYTVYPEVIRKTTYPATLILDEQDSSNNVTFTIHQTTVTTGIPDLQNPGFNSVKIFPNPAGDIVHLQLNTGSAEDLELSLCDIAGKTVERMTFHTSQGENLLTLPIYSLPAGMYFIKVSCNQHNNVVCRLAVMK